MSALTGLGHRLYTGQMSIDFIGKRKTWYIVSAVILLVSVGALFTRGLNLGIEFRGGADFAVPSASCSIEQARGVAEARSGAQAIVTETGNGTVRVQTEALSPAESSVLAGELASACGVDKGDLRTPGRRADMGCGDLQEGAPGPDRVHPARDDLPVDLL